MVFYARQFSFVLFLAALVGLSWTSAATSTDVDSPPVFRDGKTGLEFRDIEGLKRLDVYRYDQPELGYAVDYESPQGMRISIYVYDLGVADIPDGAFSDVVKQQFEQAKGDIRRARDQGKYQDADEILNEVVVLGDSESSPKMRRSRFNLRRDDRAWISHVYLTGYKKNFVKIRCSYPADHEAVSEKLFAKLLAKLGEMLAPDQT